MARVGRRFVASSVNGKLEYGVVFYDLPKPFQRLLCRVNAYYVHPKIITNSWPSKGQRFWEDDLEISRRYAVWTNPSHPDGNDDAALKACAAYRDFDNSFTSDTSDPEREPALLDMVLKSAQGEGRPPFPIRCVMLHSPDPRGWKPCDSRKVLRKWSLSQLRQVRNESVKAVEGGAVHLDTLFMQPPSAKVDYSISIESWAPAAFRKIQPTDIREVSISIWENCGC